MAMTLREVLEQLRDGGWDLQDNSGQLVEPAGLLIAWGPLLGIEARIDDHRLPAVILRVGGGEHVLGLVVGHGSRLHAALAPVAPFPPPAL